MSLASLAASSDLPHEFLLIMESISGVALGQVQQQTSPDNSYGPVKPGKTHALPLVLQSSHLHTGLETDGYLGGGREDEIVCIGLTDSWKKSHMAP